MANLGYIEFVSKFTVLNYGKRFRRISEQFESNASFYIVHWRRHLETIIRVQ